MSSPYVFIYSHLCSPCKYNFEKSISFRSSSSKSSCCSDVVVIIETIPLLLILLVEAAAVVVSAQGETDFATAWKNFSVLDNP